jgi:hypothetical protein
MVGVIMGIFDRQLTDEELTDEEIQAQMLGGVPLRPEEVQGIPEGVPTNVPQIAADQANQIVEADNAPQEPAPLTPDTQPTQETPKESANIFDNFVPNAEPTPEQSMQQKLWAEYEASKAGAGDRRNQAQMLDAFEQMNRSLAGRAGNKITGGPTNVSQLAKDPSMSELLAKYRMLSGDKNRELKSKEIDAKKKAREETVAEKALKESKKPSKAQEQVDKEFGKDYASYVAGGGYADAVKQLDQLKDVREQLKNTDMATGGVVGNIPKAIKDTFGMESGAMQDSVEEVVQRNLRTVLGAQFTEKEGERLISRAYNPRLSEKENGKRLDRLIKQIEDAAKAKQEAAEFYEKNGTLTGFKSKMYNSANDFLSDIKEEKAPKSMKADSHPEKSEAEKWALANINNPETKEKAEKILQRLGK